MTEDDDRSVASLGEEGLIEIFRGSDGRLGNHVLVPNGDDAAAWFVEPGFASIATTDSLVEGTHFDLSYTPPRAVGRKLVAVNVSDVAAMGGHSRYLLLSICIPPDCRIRTARQIALGVEEACDRHDVTVIGGNTTSIRGPMVLTATAIGRAERHALVTRRGTQVGDAILVTGHLGEARAGLALVGRDGRPPDDSPLFSLYRALVDPKPRVVAGRKLGQAGLVHAMCDISDGFGRDLGRLLGPEGLGARIDACRLPISPALREFAARCEGSAEREALAGGEDYELLLTADPNDEAEIAQLCATAATPVHRVGFVTQEPKLEVVMPDGAVEPLPAGYEHYRED